MDDDRKQTIMRHAFTQVNVVNGTLDMDVQPNMTIYVDGDRIEAVEAGAPEGADKTGYTQHDMKGAFAAPGLINLHAHHFGTGKPAANLSAGASQDRLLAFAKTWAGHLYLDRMVASNVKNALMSGVTTLRGVGDLEYSDVRVRDKINAGKLVGPRFLVSGPAMTVPGGHGAGTFARTAEKPEEFRALVRDNVEHGVDFIKTCTTGGVMDSLTPGECGLLRMNVEQVKAISEEAHAHGLYVASHTESSEGIEVDLKGGVHTVEHGSPLNPELIELFHQTGAVDICTISVALPMAKLPCEQTKMPEATTYNANVVFERIVQGARDCLAADIPVGLGTDAACPYITAYDFWRELHNFSRYCEVSPSFALHTATQVNARILGLDDETGTVEPGKCADLIFCDDNPLDDLSTLRNLKAVMARGRLFESPAVKRMPELDKVLDGLM